MTSLKLHRTALTAAILSFGLGAGAVAQGGAGTPGSPSTPAAAAKPGGDAKALAKDDRVFVEKAAMHGLAEVQLGQLAQEKAASEQVRQFGARMVKDHGKANEELKHVAGNKGVQLPTAVDKKQAQDMQKLQKLSGAEFDREYMKHMVDAHEKDISDFEKQSKSGKDPDIKNFAAKTLPTLQEHLKQAQLVDGAVKGAKSSSRGS